jgi:ATP-dependent Clp protease ATP-binding subunit ClpA
MASRARSKLRGAGDFLSDLRGRLAGGDRFDRFTTRAREVLSLAETEARELRHGFIGTEHILLGLAAHTDGVTAAALGRYGIDYERARAKVLESVGGGDAPPEARIGLTPRAKRSIELAVEESQRLKHSYVGSEHLLLGLTAVGEGVAFDVLAALGADLESLRAAVADALAERNAAVAPQARSNVVACRVDDRAMAAIEALVEAGIRQTRSEAAAWLIQAGIDANADLFERVHTTAREIQRLREQMHAAAQELAARGPARAS